jgi:hypothetical protein
MMASFVNRLFAKDRSHRPVFPVCTAAGGFDMSEMPSQAVDNEAPIVGMSFRACARAPNCMILELPKCRFRRPRRRYRASPCWI